MFELPFEPPVQEIQLADLKARKIAVYMKREDLLHPFISGNKWRKLKYVFKDAREKGRSKLVTFGGAWSNHLLAVACAGAKYQFRTVAFVRGEKVKNPVLSLCEAFGMQLIFVSRSAFINKESLFDSLFAKDPDAYFIDEGGRGILAARGCEEIMQPIDTSFSHVVCATGTGTTLAGLARGAFSKGIQADGICVLKGAEGISEEIDLLTGDAKNWSLHHGFHQGGYAKANDEVLLFIKEFAARTGILTDHVYTAKMLMAVIELAHSGFYTEGDKLLVIHTGGVMGLLSQL